MIDCRCYIHKYVENGEKYTDVINQIVESYLEAIRFLVGFSGIPLKQVGVYNAVPPVITPLDI